MKLCNWRLNPSVNYTDIFVESDCSIERCFKCPTGSPTANPTGSKTSKPTAKPTDDPTGSPTRSLTANWAKIVVTLNGDGTEVILKRKNTSKNEKWIITTKYSESILKKDMEDSDLEKEMAQFVVDDDCDDYYYSSEEEEENEEEGNK